jgi:hypothetical protein
MSQQWVVTHAIVCIELPLLSLLEALLKWLQKGGKGCGMWTLRCFPPTMTTHIGSQ